MNHNYVLCVNNQDYKASLECFKVYLCVPDSEAAKLNQIRVIDESGDDYLYPAEFFVGITLPDIAQKAIMKKSL